MYKFFILDLNERAGLLLKKGQFLMKARSDDFTFSLFSYKDFYVEVVMKKPENKITQIVPFNSGWRLDKYLDAIEISEEMLSYHR